MVRGFAASYDGPSRLNPDVMRSLDQHGAQTMAYARPMHREWRQAAARGLALCVTSTRTNAGSSQLPRCSPAGSSPSLSLGASRALAICEVALRLTPRSD